MTKVCPRLVIAYHHKAATGLDWLLYRIEGGRPTIKGLGKIAFERRLPIDELFVDPEQAPAFAG